MFRNSSIETIRGKSNKFFIADLETKIPIENNPNQWLQEDVLQAQQFHKEFMEGFETTPETKKELKI